MDSKGMMIFEGDILFHSVTNTINFVEDDEGFVIYPICENNKMSDLDRKNGKSMDYYEEYEVVSNVFFEMMNFGFE